MRKKIKDANLKGHDPFEFRKLATVDDFQTGVREWGRLQQKHWTLPFDTGCANARLIVRTPLDVCQMRTLVSDFASLLVRGVSRPLRHPVACRRLEVLRPRPGAFAGSACCWTPLLTPRACKLPLREPREPSRKQTAT